MKDEGGILKGFGGVRNMGLVINSFLHTFVVGFRKTGRGWGDAGMEFSNPLIP